MRLFLFQPVSLGAKTLNLLEHSLQECFRGGGRYPGSLKEEDFPPLTPDLRAHSFDFRSNEIKVRHRTSLEKREA